MSSFVLSDNNTTTVPTINPGKNYLGYQVLFGLLVFIVVVFVIIAISLAIHKYRQQRNAVSRDVNARSPARFEGLYAFI